MITSGYPQVKKGRTSTDVMLITKLNCEFKMSNFAIIIVVGFPLTIIGGIFGKNWAGGFNAPCRTKNIPREIPPMPW